MNIAENEEKVFRNSINIVGFHHIMHFVVGGR